MNRKGGLRRRQANEGDADVDRSGGAKNAWVSLYVDSIVGEPHDVLTHEVMAAKQVRWVRARRQSWQACSLGDAIARRTRILDQTGASNLG